jgi:two-component system, chemotaxis family, chemotaxis protein CheY
MKKKLLLIEDHKSLRQVVGMILSREYHVVGVQNGMEAMSWLSQGSLPDLILTDSEMPELGGKSFLQNLQYSGAFSRIPVVLIGTCQDAEEEKEYRDLGVLAFLSKPLVPADLQSAIQRIVSPSKQEEKQVVTQPHKNSVIRGTQWSLQ